MSSKSEIHGLGVWVGVLLCCSVGRGQPSGPPEAQRPAVPGPSTESELVQEIGTFRDWPYATGNWWGVRDGLAARGVVVEPTVTIDHSVNLMGGVSTHGSDTRHLLDVPITIDTQKLLGWGGGTFFVNYQNHNGPDPAAMTGSLFPPSTIDADGRSQVTSLWYEQAIMDDQLRVRLGKMDANDLFAVVVNGQEFINSTLPTNPTILSLPTYPDTSTGLTVLYAPCEAFYVGGGVFDGAVQEGVLTGGRGAATLFGEPADLFIIGESGVRWSLGEDALEGRLAVGGWHHTGTFLRFDGGTESGVSGFYLIVEQMVWLANPADESDGRGVGCFVEYGTTDGRVSVVEHFVGAGITWTGPIAGREADAAGMAVAWSQVTDEPGAGLSESYEAVVEWFYKIQVTSSIAVKPDLQWVVNPGASGIDDALLATIRVEIGF
jgi:porin